MLTQKSISCMFSVLLIVMILIGSAAFPTSVRAASIVVNSLEDTVALDDNCTLREAIENANSDTARNGDCAAGSGADTITFSVSGTITLGSTLSINQGYTTALTIDGTGQTVTISGNDAVQVMYARYGSLTLNNLTIANGSAATSQGGGISNGATLTITNCTFSGNHTTAYNGTGGAIFSYADTPMTITNSTFSGNTASIGGAIYNSSSGGNQVTITNSTFSGNSAPGGLGGGIYNRNSYGTLTITNSTFSDNGASWGSGGGIYNYDGSLTIRTSTFSGNSAGTGGGIYNSSIADASTIIANSTFSGNSASASGSNGGGIYNSGAYTQSTIIMNSTFSGNSVPGSGGGIGNAGGTVTLRNTIVANNTSGNCSGAITNGTNNIDSGTTCGWGATKGSMSLTNPLLGALTGSPAYFPLNPGSPAIDKGEDTICVAWPVNNQSQNGVTRPQGAHCDIGAYELKKGRLTYRSIAASDGWILESAENGNAGKKIDSTSTTLRLGDDAAKKQYRSILSFTTLSLPDTAVITKVTLKVRRQGVVGSGNPVTAFLGFMVDIRRGTFGTSALQATDWQVTANKTLSPVAAPFSSGWYTLNLTSVRAYINKLATGGGLTQIRLRFKLDDNNNTVANYLSLYSGNAGAASRPQLIIEYYVP